MGRPDVTGRLTRPPPGKIKRVLVRVGLSVTVLAIVLWMVDLDRAREGLERLELSAWLIGLGAWAVLHSASALKWRYMLRLSGAVIPRRHALTCHAAGLFANLCLPSLIGGDVLRAGLALRATDRKAALVFGSVMDRVFDLTALLSVAAFGLVNAPFVEEKLGGGGGALAAFAGVLLLGAFGGWFALAVAVGRARRLPRKVGKKVIEVARALRTVRRAPLAAALGWSMCVGIQAGFVLVNVHLGESVGLELDLGLWFVLWPLAKIIAMLPISFGGGLGVREMAFKSLVEPFGSGSLAVVQSLVWQSILIFGGLLAGLFWMTSPAPAAPEGQDA